LWKTGPRRALSVEEKSFKTQTMESSAPRCASAACAAPLAPPAPRCAACLSRPSYCGAACQRADWPRHRERCRAEATRLRGAVVERAAAPLAACLAAARRVVGRGVAAAPPPPLALAQLVARASRGALRLAEAGAGAGGGAGAGAGGGAGGRGRALVAARPLRRLEELLVEEATAWLPAHLGDELSGALIPGLLEFVPAPAPAPAPAPDAEADDDGGLCERLRSLLRLEPFRLADGAGAAVDASLSLVGALAPLARRNALGLCFDDELPAGERDLMVFAPALLMANHSCAPNAVAAGVWNGRAPAARLVAERDVAEGEEVTISYVPRGAPRAERRATLQRLHGFVCDCERCGAAEAGEGAPEREREREREQAWLSAEIAQFGAPLWKLRPEERPARVEAALASGAAAARGPLALWDLTLLAGHVSALVLGGARAEQARRHYAEAAALAAALFGATSHRAKLVAAFAGGRGVASEREVVEFERARAAPAFARWEGLPEAVHARWRRPVRAEAEAEAEAGGRGRSVAELAAELAELGRRALEAADVAR